MRRRVDKRKSNGNDNRFSGQDGCRVYQDREFTADEVEFASAMETFRRMTGTKFPTCSQVLAVLISLGYRKC